MTANCKCSYESFRPVSMLCKVLLEFVVDRMYAAVIHMNIDNDDKYRCIFTPPQGELLYR